MEKQQMKLSESLEDYLEAIAELIEEEGHAHAKEIARMLGVPMPSVTGALRQLVKLGYIEYNVHYPVVLTPAGAEIAHRVIHRHQALKRFFSQILGLPLEKASQCACHIEHVVDEDTVRRFDLFSDAIEHRSDARSLQIHLTEAISNLSDEATRDLVVLSSLAAGDVATVAAFGRNLPASNPHQLSVGDRLTVQGWSLDKSLLLAVKGKKTLEIPLAYAEDLWVRK